MNRYASGTSVGEDRSRSEIEYLLARFGADRFGYATDRVQRVAKIMFQYKGADFVFPMPIASKDDKAMRHHKGGRPRTDIQIEKAVKDENRRRWRSLCLAIKAMLVGVEDGIFNFAEIMMPFMVWGDGRTTAQTLLPIAEQALAAGRSLPSLSDPSRLLEAGGGGA
jgi:hypothetical protein